MLGKISPILLEQSFKNSIQLLYATSDVRVEVYPTSLHVCVCVCHGIWSCSSSSSSMSLVWTSGFSGPNRADRIFPNRPGLCCCRRSLIARESEREREVLKNANEVLQVGGSGYTTVLSPQCWSRSTPRRAVTSPHSSSSGDVPVNWTSRCRSTKFTRRQVQKRLPLAAVGAGLGT